MTEISDGKYTFQAKEIKRCYDQSTQYKGDHLSKLFEEKVGRGLPKPKLLEILFGYIIASPKDEFDENRKAKRPIIELIQKVCRLSSLNFQPSFYSRWRETQESGYIGDPIE